MRGEFNGKRIEVLGYSISVPEISSHNDIVVERLHTMMLHQVARNAEASGYMRPYEDAIFTVGKPFRSYDHNGYYIHQAVLLTVEIPVVKVDNPAEGV